MYRGSRLAASFLLVLTGSAAVAAALFVVPATTPGSGAWWLAPVALAAGLAHFVALAGIARGRDWGRSLAVFVAEMGGGVAILGIVALITGAKLFGASPSTGAGLLAWSALMYALLGIAAGRVPVLARLTPLERRRAVFGPSFAGIVA